MACGTPVAAYARGALPEIVDADCGVLVPPGDVEALARAMRERPPATGARTSRARTTSRCERMVDRYERLYRETTSWVGAA